MQISVRCNVWAIFPDPEHIRTERAHSRFDGEFARANIIELLVRAAMAPYPDRQCAIDARSRNSLTMSNQSVRPLDLGCKDGRFAKGNARERKFATARPTADKVGSFDSLSRED